MSKKPSYRRAAHGLLAPLALACACGLGLHNDTSAGASTSDATDGAGTEPTGGASDTTAGSDAATAATAMTTEGATAASAESTGTIMSSDATDGATTGAPASCDAPDRTVRVATWNIASVGAPGSEQHEAARAILARLDADLVALNEIDGDQDIPNLEALAAASGYDQVFVPDQNPFGELRNAILSRLPLVSAFVHDAAALSGDPTANDIARPFVQATLDRPEPCVDLTVIVAHYKAGWEPADDFRRAVEAARMAQAGALADGYTLLVGDFNEELDQGPHDPDPLTALPAGLPVTYALGADLSDMLEGPGLRNHPFFYLEDPGWGDHVALDAQQLDGDWSTRVDSSRRIDYLMIGPALQDALAGEDAGAQTEVYNSAHEPLDVGQGLSKLGDPLPVETSALASDHHVVLAELSAP